MGQGRSSAPLTWMNSLAMGFERWHGIVGLYHRRLRSLEQLILATAQNLIDVMRVNGRPFAGHVPGFPTYAAPRSERRRADRAGVAAASFSTLGTAGLNESAHQ